MVVQFYFLSFVFCCEGDNLVDRLDTLLRVITAPYYFYEFDDNDIGLLSILSLT